MCLPMCTCNMYVGKLIICVNNIKFVLKVYYLFKIPIARTFLCIYIFILLYTKCGLYVK